MKRKQPKKKSLIKHDTFWIMIIGSFLLKSGSVFT